MKRTRYLLSKSTSINVAKAYEDHAVDTFCIGVDVPIDPPKNKLQLAQCDAHQSACSAMIGVYDMP